MSKLGNIGARLYRGEVAYDFVGRRKTWYTLSAVILLLAIVGLVGRGLNLGIEFRGGAEFQVVSTSTSGVEEARGLVTDIGIEGPIVTQLGNGTIRIQTRDLTDEETSQVVADLAQAFDVAEGEVRVQIVGPSWGSDITSKAIQALWVFLLLVSIFLAVTFEWRMAFAALIALIHDVVITIGIYALTGFEVTPATVIGVLTILGFSLYDTVVVFDKVKENTKNIERQTRFTYSGAANLALNQTLVRSINTSIVALLPVTAILIIGAGILGAGTLRDLSLALFVGMLAGTYSSITVATPVLAQLKEKQPSMIALAKRVGTKAGFNANVATNEAPTGRVVTQNASTRTAPRRHVPRSKRK
ncbi:MAG: protein translocase subunit SecF [Actinomycetota bacterium]|jgi:preprotein translocase subunit SecF